MDVEITDNAADAYERLRVDRQRTLTGPEDDMWATLADEAEPHALTRRGELIGRFSVDDRRQLHAFYVTDEFEPMAFDLLVRVIKKLDISAVMASTVDPLLLSLGLAAGGMGQPKALMYDHLAACESDETVDLRLAGTEDRAAAVAFCQAQNRVTRRVPGTVPGRAHRGAGAAPRRNRGKNRRHRRMSSGPTVTRQRPPRPDRVH